MMLQIDHRVSRDVDIFLADPQQLGFLDPRTRDFEFEIQPTDYSGDGAGSLKLVFDDIGEIDFIVAQEMTSSPATATTVEGEVVLLETIAEIITKKIYYRRANIKPRDIFDIAAAGEEHADSLIEELRNYRQEVAQTLTTIDTLNTDFVNGAIAELEIRDRYKEIAKGAIERSRGILRAV